MNYKTYLFDFDYTLADSSRGIVKCFRIVLTRHQYLTVTDEAIKRTIGKTLEESFSILTGVTDPIQLETFRQEYKLEANVHMNVNTRLFPDTLSTLKALKAQGTRIGIISTKYRFRILSFLEAYLPKDFLDIVVGGEDVKTAKPSPEGVRFALEHLGSIPQETLYIGDSTVDAETARNAGVDFAGVLNGMTTEEELRAYPHRMIMENLGELVQRN
ncbi:HAD-IA family hydrolase [Bacteroides sp. AN502(2024)]|uniref:HAD-IA family hydrolase n=1 Tax=Bacteroides sp. AN502(2024) TaxID=3160599 RepID=UPI00351994F1